MSTGFNGIWNGLAQAVFADHRVLGNRSLLADIFHRDGIEHGIGVHDHCFKQIIMSLFCSSQMQLTISVNAEPPAATVDSVIPPDTIQGLSFLRFTRVSMNWQRSFNRPLLESEIVQTSQSQLSQPHDHSTSMQFLQPAGRLCHVISRQMVVTTTLRHWLCQLSMPVSLSHINCIVIEDKCNTLAPTTPISSQYHVLPELLLLR